MFTIDMLPLRSDDAATIAAQLIDDRVRREDVLRRSGGHPLLIHHWASNCTKKVPADVERETLSTLNRNPASLSLAQALCVCELPISISAAIELSGLTHDDFTEATSYLKRLRVINVTDTVTLRQTWLADLLYSKLSRVRKASLHERAFVILQKMGGIDDPSLARHASKGGFFREAAFLYHKLAREAYAAQNYQAVIQYYRFAKSLTKRAGMPSDPMDTRALAHSYSRLGHGVTANTIFKKLLASTEVQLNPELVASIHTSMANPYHGSPIAESTKRYLMAIESLPENSPKAISMKAALPQFLVLSGDLNAAQMTIRMVEAQFDFADNPTATWNLEFSRSFLLLHSGRFRESAEILDAMSLTDNPLQSIAVLTNLALCREHLGQMKLALKSQRRAEQIAQESKSALGKVLCSINIGAFERKIGHFDHARSHLTNANALLTEYVLLEKGMAPLAATDLALLQIDEGEYDQALKNLQRAERYLNGNEIDRVNAVMAFCELSLAFERPSEVKRLLKSLEGSQIFQTDFFKVELLLFNARLEDVDCKAAADFLTHALTVARSLGTFNQICRALIGLADVNLKTGDLKAAQQAAMESLQLSRRHRYRPLAARALMFSGLSSQTHREFIARLVGASHMAGEVGLPELLAECSFHLGQRHRRDGHFVNAMEQLAKCTAITADLVHRIPPEYRSRYSRKGWRREVEPLLGECQAQLSVSFQGIRNLFGNSVEHRLFSALYRFAVSISRAPTSEAVVSVLVRTLEGAIEQPAVVRIISKTETNWYPIQMKLELGLRNRIDALVAKFRGRIYLDGPIHSTRGETVAWIPFTSLTSSGGIYVRCTRKSPPLRERILEFLALVGSLVGPALDRVQGLQTDMSAASPEFAGIVGSSPNLKRLHAQIEIAASNVATVLIEGESGTGKELVAKAIHQNCVRAKGPFIPVDCGAIPEGLIEVELFGAKRGAYTGAVTDRAGLFEAANQGTIFLDEIANMSLAVQAKLLRVLQEREVRRIGETKGRPIDVRMMVATNCSLDQLVREGKFRQDLLYRLKVLHIRVPPLRNRRDDIPLLATTFLTRLNSANNVRKYFGPGVLEQLTKHQYPGNVRELQNAVERAFFSIKGNAINEVQLEQIDSQPAATQDEVQTWFKDLTEGRKNFWSAVHDRYKRRDISRERVVALIDFGLRSARGSYKTMSEMLQMKETEYRRFMDFLRRNDCLLDFRPYRKSANKTA
jgi:DNA-binding NtrC family response regulator/tetratricopeptide (TPR) repeat protein